MKRFWWIVPVILGIVGGIGYVRLRQATGPDRISFRQSRQVMGTLASIEAVGPDGSDQTLRDAVHRAFAAIDQVEAIMSHYRDGSLVGRINRLASQQPIELDPWTAEVLGRAEVYWRMSHGAFDPTCGPLIELWKRCGKEDRLPSDDELAEARSRTGFDKVELKTDVSPPTIRFTQPGMRIDLGGIAKGFASDLAAEELRRSGCTGGLVVIGGDIRSFGSPDDDEHWRIAVQSPFDQGALLTLALDDAAVSTSGNYHRFAMIGGHRYSHIIDPRTGYPAEATPSVTVVGPRSIGTDALATAVNVLGLAEGLRLLEEVPGYETMMVVGKPESFEMKESTGFAKYR